MDSVYLYDKYGSPMAYDSWSHVRRPIDWVADNWMKPDDGIWEVRGGQRQFIYSKVQCWVALDRDQAGDEAQSATGSCPLARGARPHLRSGDDARLGRGAADIRAVFRHRRAGRGQPHHAAGVLHLADRPPHDRDDQPHDGGAGF